MVFTNGVFIRAFAKPGYRHGSSEGCGQTKKAFHISGFPLLKSSRGLHQTHSEVLNTLQPRFCQQGRLAAFRASFVVHDIPL